MLKGYMILQKVLARVRISLFGEVLLWFFVNLCYTMHMGFCGLLLLFEPRFFWNDVWLPCRILLPMGAVFFKQTIDRFWGCFGFDVGCEAVWCMPRTSPLVK